MQSNTPDENALPVDLVAMSGDARRQTPDWVYPIIGLAVLLGLWEVSVRLFSDGFLVPTASGTFTAFVSLLGTRELWNAIAKSNQAMVIGLAASLAVGIPLGFLMGRWRKLELAASAYMDFFVVVPMAVIIPLLIMALGLTLAARATVVFVFAFVFVAVNARAAIRSVNPALVDMARSCGANELDIWRMILLPGSLPGVMAGVRIGVVRAVSGMLVAELLLFSVGLGGMVLRFRGFLQADRMYATVLVVVLEALVLISLARRLEKRVAARWGG